MGSERQGVPVDKAAEREYDQHAVSEVPTGSKKRSHKKRHDKMLTRQTPYA